jgi:hypothetical protein
VDGIAFVGDIHGRIWHLLSLLLELRRTGHAIDRVVQVGDFGAYRGLDHVDEATRRYAHDDPAELDFVRMLEDRSDGLHHLLRHIRAELEHPILFLRGNHEDHTASESRAISV